MQKHNSNIKEEHGKKSEENKTEEKGIEVKEENSKSSNDNLEALKKLIEEKDKEIEELINHLKRLQAEFENYKKRVEKDKEQTNSIVLKEFIKELLPVLDSFEIALKNTADLKNFKSGVELIYAQLYNLLKNHGVSEIKALGEKFNPLYHEVLMTEDSEIEKDTIIEEFQKGYLLNGFVLRTAKVKISLGRKIEEQSSKSNKNLVNEQENKKC
ncbi:MAG: nucleotide exchange factor GrpE [Candidatus Woesearchaeota archaeon]